MPLPLPRIAHTHTWCFSLLYIVVVETNYTVLLVSGAHRARNEHQTEQIETSFLVIARVYRKSFLHIFCWDSVHELIHRAETSRALAWQAVIVVEVVDCSFLNNFATIMHCRCWLPCAQ